MIKLLQISQQRDLVVTEGGMQTAKCDICAQIVIDWAIKSVNFELDKDKDQQQISN